MPRMELSTIVKRLEQVRFMDTDTILIHVDIHVLHGIRVRLCFFFFVVWCRWWWGGVGGVERLREGR